MYPPPRSPARKDAGKAVVFSPVVSEDRKSPAAATPGWNPFDDVDPFADVQATHIIAAADDDPFGMRVLSQSMDSQTFKPESPGSGSPRATRGSSAQSPDVSRLHRAHSSGSQADSSEETFRMMRRESVAESPGKPRLNKSPSSSENPFDDDGATGSPSFSGRAARSDTMANSDSAESDADAADDDNAGAKSPKTAPRSLFPKDSVARYVNDAMHSEAAMHMFLTSSIAQGTTLQMVVRYHQGNKSFMLELAEPQTLLLVAHKRRDGLKALALSSNYSICMVPMGDDNCALPYQEQKRMVAQMAGNEALRIAKMRGNMQGSLFTVYDQGKNPNKALGALDARRELASIRFAIVPAIYTRRATYVLVPLPGSVVRPTSAADTLIERNKRSDRSVLALSPMMPRAAKTKGVGEALPPAAAAPKPPRLPRIEDYMGVADKHSIKNMMLHDPATLDILLVLGKVNQFTFRLVVTYPFSPVTAFATALASFESLVRPQAQI